MSISKDELWKTFIKSNPHWEVMNIKLTPVGLKKLVEQTYDHGFKHGRYVEKCTQNVKNKNAPKKKNDIFDQYGLGDMFK